jgi:hypothetical protein
VAGPLPSGEGCGKAGWIGGRVLAVDFYSIRKPDLWGSRRVLSVREAPVPSGNVG